MHSLFAGSRIRAAIFRMLGSALLEQQTMGHSARGAYGARQGWLAEAVLLMLARCGARSSALNTVVGLRKALQERSYAVRGRCGDAAYDKHLRSRTIPASLGHASLLRSECEQGQSG